jgi:peroxiredoxin
MRGSFKALAATLSLLALVAAPAWAGGTAKVGEAAPGFTLTDSNGNEHSLASFKGKFVVLEWINHDCPFVKKHYDSGNMQKLQKTYTDQGVVWLSVNSSAPGKQGNFPPEKINALTTQKKAAPTAYLLDPEGTVGRAYGAKTTPHMYLIDREGTLIYAGGIDDTKSTDVADVATATPFVKNALDEALSGKPVTVATSTPYGCSVKYEQ